MAYWEGDNCRFSPLAAIIVFNSFSASSYFPSLCSKVAKLLRGKYKPTFTPHVDCGDNVIIINADKVVFSGKKETDKVYTRYTGYPGGQRFNTPAELRKREGGIDKIIRHAVKGMLPKGPLGRSLMDNLYVYEGTEHKHEAQKPKAIDINQYK